MARTWNRAVPTGEGTTRNAQQDPAKSLAAVSTIPHPTDRTREPVVLADALPEVWELLEQLAYQAKVGRWSA